MGEREREGNPSKWVSGSRERETKDEGRGCLLRTPSVERGRFLLGFPFIVRKKKRKTMVIYLFLPYNSDLKIFSYNFF
jgi:hypothetical protein